LIAQGIQKGIDKYKKQQKAKARELDKRLKVARQQDGSAREVEIQERIVYRQYWLPWTLLVLTWLGVGVYLFFN